MNPQTRRLLSFTAAVLIAVFGLSMAAAQTPTHDPFIGDICFLHFVAEGDTPASIAEQYGGDLVAMLEANGLTEASASRLQIGQLLIVPMEGCDLRQDISRVAEQDAPHVEIAHVMNAGDITNEYVEIVNRGSRVDITGWRIYDDDGYEYTFLEQSLIAEQTIRIYTAHDEQGSETQLSWGLDTAIYDPGEWVLLFDAEGLLQGAYRVSDALVDANMDEVGTGEYRIKVTNLTNTRICFLFLLPETVTQITQEDDRLGETGILEVGSVLTIRVDTGTYNGIAVTQDTDGGCDDDTGLLITNYGFVVDGDETWDLRLDG